MECLTRLQHIRRFLIVSVKLEIMYSPDSRIHVELLRALVLSVGRSVGWSRGGNCRQDTTRYPNEPGASLITRPAMHPIRLAGIPQTETIVFVHPPTFSWTYIRPLKELFCSFTVFIYLFVRWSKGNISFSNMSLRIIILFCILILYFLKFAKYLLNYKYKVRV